MQQTRIGVHSWGGLGSQLFAIAFYRECLARYQSRELVIVHHTSGVTRREINEWLFYNLEIPYVICDDFRPRRITMASSHVLVGHFFELATRCIKSWGKIAMQRTRIVLYPDNTNQLTLSPWTKQIRGHYFRREISMNQILEFKNLFSSCDTWQLPRQKTLIHYRLGDLVTLENKKPISFERVKIALNASPSEHQREGIGIVSDSQRVQVETEFSRYSREYPGFRYLDIDIISLIKTGITADTFIGTNSKISLWISLFRSLDSGSGKQVTFLPVEMKKDILSICPKACIEYY